MPLPTPADPPLGPQKEKGSAGEPTHFPTEMGKCPVRSQFKDPGTVTQDRKFSFPEQIYFVHTLLWGCQEQLSWPKVASDSI